MSYTSKVLAIPRKRWLRPNMTEKLFTGTLSIKPNQILHKHRKKTKQYALYKHWKQKDKTVLTSLGVGIDTVNACGGFGHSWRGEI